MELSDVNDLRPDRLAAAGEHLALAALAFHDNQVALQRLAECAQDPEAFRWLWAITSRRPHLRDVFTSLPSGVIPPADLAEQVLHLLLSRDSNDVGHQQLLLKRLDPRHPGTVDAAMKIVGGNAPSPHNADLRMMALRVLARSPDSEIRKEVITHLGSVDLAAQAKIATALPDPLADTEAHAVHAVIKACTDRQTALDQAAALAVRLPTEQLHELFTQPWPPHPQRRDSLLQPVATRLPVAKLIELVSNEAAPDDLVEPTLRFAISRNDHDVAEIGEWAHAHCADAMAKPLRDHIIELLVRRPRQNPERREELLEILRRFAAAAPPDNPAPAAALAGVLRPGELEASVDGNDAAAIRRAGVLIARIHLNNNEPAEFGDEIATLAQRAINADELVAWADGLMTGGPLERVPDEIVALVLADPDAIKLAVDRGERDRVIDVAIQSEPTAAASVLKAAVDGLTDEQITRLLERVSWTNVPAETYCDVISAIASRPAQVAQEATNAINSAFGPEHAAIGEDLLQHVLEVVADSGASVALGDEHITELLAHRTPSVAAAAAVWATTLPPTEDNVQAAIAADGVTGASMPQLGDLRRHYAHQLAAVAGDKTKDNAVRGAALRLAAVADPTTARATAFTIAETARTPSLRQAAADVLVETPGDSSEVDRLYQLAGGETHTAIKARLETAARHITSGSIGEAIRNLAELVDLDIGDQSDAEVFVPDEDRHGLFTSCVDQLRGAPEHDFEAFIDRANVLCELLVDLAVLASADAKLVNMKPEDADLIRRNAPKRFPTGALIVRQDLIQQFVWLPVVSTLRLLRNAHPAATNSTEPVRRTRADGDASRTLLQRIVAGWMASMRDAHAVATTGSE